MTEYTKKQKISNYNLSKNVNRKNEDFLSVISSAGSNAYDFIKNAFEDLLSNATYDILVKNSSVKDKKYVKNLNHNHFTNNKKDMDLTNKASLIKDAGLSNAQKNIPLSHDVIDKHVSLPKTESIITPNNTSNIKERVKSALLYANDTITLPQFNLFDDIDDETIERSIPIALETFKSNISRGVLPDNAIKKYPYLIEGLTLFYAASEKGKNKAANKARNIAYMTAPELYPTGKTHNQGYYRRNVRNNNIITNSTSVSFDKDKLNYNPKNNKDLKPEIELSKDDVGNENCIKYDATSNVYYGVAVEMKDNSFEDLEYSDYSKEEIIKYLGISEKDFIEDENKLIKKWKSLAKLSSTGEMQNVLLDMIDHFIDGTGTDYSNKVLTQKVREHAVTKKFISGFTDIFNAYVNLCNGDIRSFANSESFKEALKSKDLFLSKYNYEGIDTFTGLTLAIHGWTTCEVDVTKFKLNLDGTYTGNLEFTFIDNFGLDSNDKDDFWGLDGFHCWFTLQHYNKFNKQYKPFRTIVKINQPISGKINN